MSVLPAGIDTDRALPTAIPLRHFVVAFAFLLAGVAVGGASAAGLLGGWAALAHVHLLLLGWVCITIMGAMTQFVPVWSGTTLHSRRLATAQLWLVASGLTGMVGAMLTGHLVWVHAFGGLAVLGFWAFAYNVGRTLLRLDALDVTERHFAAVLAFVVLTTSLGFVLALDFTFPVVAPLGLARVDVVGAHATLAVFGVVLTTVIGALYQLATMFTGTTLGRTDRALQRVETAVYPVGVLALAAGRLVASAPLARAGGVLVALGLLAMAVVLTRRLATKQVAWTPMLHRYAVLALATTAWAVLAVPAWLDAPLYGARFGAPGTAHLLAVGVIGFAVTGTLYHVVPFLVWVDRYTDRLGLEPVPMIDDLYDARIATADLLLCLAGTISLVAGDAFDAAAATQVGGAALAVGLALFVANLLLVVRRHSPHSVASVLVSRRATDADAATDGATTDGAAEHGTVPGGR